MDKLGCGDGFSRGRVSIKKKKERTQNEQDKTSLLKRS